MFSRQKIPDFEGFTPENIIKIETILNDERNKYMSRVRKDNDFYIQKLKIANYTYSDSYYTFTFNQIDKLIYFIFDDMKKEWKIKYTERH